MIVLCEFQQQLKGGSFRTLFRFAPCPTVGVSQLGWNDEAGKTYRTYAGKRLLATTLSFGSGAGGQSIGCGNRTKACIGSMNQNDGQCAAISSDRSTTGARYGRGASCSGSAFISLLFA
jgi:hypothetical protein